VVGGRRHQGRTSGQSPASIPCASATGRDVTGPLGDVPAERQPAVALAGPPRAVAGEFEDVGKRDVGQRVRRGAPYVGRACPGRPYASLRVISTNPVGYLAFGFRLGAELRSNGEHEDDENRR